ncbi:efflux RND transporter periplasmic adaptor subunit [uncultured Paracoccus sp.]|uniref:efflux RND transporter periplasmic adaptor subunit n=1 Tax=uncultured Paracoccus sp. TaxID=189685 RepID=UPI0025D6D3AE|nr:efflux RND transporter periplasmic adaptor subunit [uncultured Paracoccus sp.]
MKRRTWVVLLAAALLAVGAWHYMAGGGQGAQAPAVMTAPVTRGDIEETVLAEGTLRPRRLVAVGAQVSGRILSVDVTAGQQVRAGDPIAEIDSITQVNALRNAEAALANVLAQRTAKEAELAQFRRVEERQRRMLQSRTVSQADYDAAEQAVAVAQAQIDALEAQIEQAEVAIETARANVDYTRITAPIDGTVLAVVSQEGQTVNAVQSAPTIVVLGQLDEMTVRAQISEADITRVAEGQPVWFTVLGNTERRFEGQLQMIEPAPESIVNDSAVTGTAGTSTTSTAIYYNANFDIPNADGHLRTYMTAQVHIVTGRAADALLVPVAGLGERAPGGGHHVRVQTPGGGIETREVRIGLNDRNRAEVLEGLSEGERVVTGGSDAMPGAPAQGAGRRTRSPMGF